MRLKLESISAPNAINNESKIKSATATTMTSSPQKNAALEGQSTERAAFLTSDSIKHPLLSGGLKTSRAITDPQHSNSDKPKRRHEDREELQSKRNRADFQNVRSIVTSNHENNRNRNDGGGGRSDGRFGRAGDRGVNGGGSYSRDQRTGNNQGYVENRIGGARASGGNGFGGGTNNGGASISNPSMAYFEEMNRVAQLSGFQNAKEMLDSQKEVLSLMHSQPPPVPPMTSGYPGGRSNWRGGGVSRGSPRGGR